jgi:hypothetical protein
MKQFQSPSKYLCFTESVNQPHTRRTRKTCYAPQQLAEMRTVIPICGQRTGSKPYVGHMRRAVWVSMFTLIRTKKDYRSTVGARCAVK